MSFFAEVDQSNKVLRVVVCDTQEYLEQRLGGTWVETVTESAQEYYAGIEMGYDPTSIALFAPDWVQPTAENPYTLGTYVFHNGLIWQSRAASNVWEPGVFGWRDRTGQIPKWVQPLGAQDAFDLGEQCMHAGKIWQSNVPANVWEPGAQGITQWDEIAPDAQVNEWPNWEQPAGAHDAYKLGAKVTHNEQRGINTGSNANVWAPGVFGWTVQP